MPKTAFRRLSILAVLAATASAALGAEPVTLTPQQRSEMTALAKQALAADVAASDKAVDALKALGDPAKPRLVSALKELLVRGRTAVGAAKRRVSDPEKARQLEAEIVKVRAAAVANIAKLEKGEPIRLAHEYYEKLGPMLDLLNKVQEVRHAVYTSMKRRARLVALWQEVGGEDRRISAEGEATLKADAEAVLGMSLEAVAAIPEFGQGDPPSDPAAWQLWFYDACRRIDAYNASLAGQMSPAEAENVRLLNTYREMLGTLPLEVDARLLQSARRHSKEMVEKGYFAHESPTPSEKTHANRMANAGYSSGYSENIAAGSTGGGGVFWMWFDSPGHHQNMVHAGSKAMGVGAWASTWTQNFGTGQRLMLLDAQERKKVVVKGDIVPPRGSGAPVRKS